MINLLTKLLVSFKPVLKNAMYLGIIDVVNLLITLLALPYIIKTGSSFSFRPSSPISSCDELYGNRDRQTLKSAHHVAALLQNV